VDSVNVSLRDESPLVVIDIAGEMTVSARESMTEAYRAACDRGARHILLNLAGVRYLNTAGIAIIIDIMTDALQSQRDILITGLTPHYRRLYRLMELDRFASVFDSEDAARRFVLERASLVTSEPRPS
jgi:anti-anti-sigma factor